MEWIGDHLSQVLNAAGFFITAVLGWIIKKQVTEVHVTMNSRLDALLLSVANAARLEGAAAEKLRNDAAAGIQAEKSHVAR